MNRILLNCVISILFFFLTVVCIRFIAVFRSKKDNGNAESFFLKPSVKQMFFYGVIFVMNIIAGVLLEVFFKDNSVLFIFSRLTVLLIMQVAAYFDLKSYIIPNQIIVFGLAARAVLLFFELIYANEGLLQSVIEQLISAVALTIGGVICSFIMKNGFGMGDVKLFALVGLFFGATGSFTIIFMSLLVSFFFSVFMLVTKRKEKKDVIPFAPCVLLGSWVAIIFFGV